MNTKVQRYYDKNQEYLDEAWQEYLANDDWGSGEDTIKITDDMFWEFVEDTMYDELGE